VIEHVFPPVSKVVASLLDRSVCALPLQFFGGKCESAGQDVSDPGRLIFCDRQQRAVGLEEPDEEEVVGVGVTDASVEAVSPGTRLLGKEISGRLVAGGVHDDVDLGSRAIDEVDMVSLRVVDRWPEPDQTAADRSRERVRDRDDVVAAPSGRSR
jgi:hypothetical protein